MSVKATGSTAGWEPSEDGHWDCTQRECTWRQGRKDYGDKSDLINYWESHSLKSVIAKANRKCSLLSSSSPTVSLRVFQGLRWNQAVSFHYKSLQESFQIPVAWFYLLLPLPVWMILHRLGASPLEAIFVSLGFISQLMSSWVLHDFNMKSSASPQIPRWAWKPQDSLNKPEVNLLVCTETWNPDLLPGVLMYVYLLYGSNLFLLLLFSYFLSLVFFHWGIVASQCCVSFCFCTMKRISYALALVVQSYPTLCDCMDCSPPGSSLHGILQARILEWVAFSFSRGFSQPRDQTWVSRIAARFFTIWATSEANWMGDLVLNPM